MASSPISPISEWRRGRRFWPDPPELAQSLGRAAACGAADEYQRLGAVAPRLGADRLECRTRARTRRLRLARRRGRLDWMREQVALHPDRPAARQEVQLRTALDPLGHHL